MNTCSRLSSGSEDRYRSGTRPPALVALAVAVLMVALHPAQGAQDQGPAPSGPSSPPWYETYRKAVADAELENWEGVAAKIQQAIKANPKSERNVRTYGMWHALYIPYYYLGLAQYHMGQRS